MENKLPIVIHTPVIHDTGALSRVHLFAFKDDKCVQLMYREANLWSSVNTMVENRCKHVDYQMRIALTEDVDRIAGWLCCSLVDTDTPIQDDLAYLEWTTAAARVIECAEEELTRTSGKPEDAEEARRRRDMWLFISDASREAQTEWLATGEKRYLIINTVVTDPALQDRGVGSELLSWATSYADDEEIPIWAQVSPVAYGIFKTAGFEEVYSLALDLDECYYGKKERGNLVWGFHEFKFMARRARHRAKIDERRREVQHEVL